MCSISTIVTERLKPPPQFMPQVIKIDRILSPLLIPMTAIDEILWVIQVLADQYRNLGCNFLLEHFTNPPALGKNKGSNSIEEG